MLIIMSLTAALFIFNLIIHEFMSFENTFIQNYDYIFWNKQKKQGLILVF